MRLAVIGSAPRVNGYVASSKTGRRLGRVQAVDAYACKVDGIWISFRDAYPCEAPSA